MHGGVRHRTRAVLEQVHQRRVFATQPRAVRQAAHRRPAHLQQPVAQLWVAVEHVDEALQAIGNAGEVLAFELLLALGPGQHGGADRGHAHAQQQDHEQAPDHRREEAAQAHHSSVTAAAST